MNSQLIAAIIGALIGALAVWLVSVQTTDLQHTPAFVSESLTFVEEFTEFYDQQVSDFIAIQYSSPASGDPFDEKQKKFVDEAQTKLFNAERKADLLELKATRYFHETEWLPLFVKVHTIWGQPRGSAVYL